ncbi:MAG: ribbon-helix-helix protein, CopG family [Patulibacter sp.]
MTTTAMSLRLPTGTNDALDAVAHARGTSKTAVIRAAIDQYLADLRGDAQFKAELEAAHQRHQRAMELLA